MKRILVVYGTTKGHTRKIAERMADVLRQAGHEAEARDAASIPDRTFEEHFDGILVGGSVHAGEHQKSVREFVRRNRERLAAVPSAFFSVSLTAAEPDEESRRDVEAAMEQFVDETGWTPDRLEPVAGALAYSQYNLFVRHLMKLIAKRHGRPIDTSHDYDYTDWGAVEAFARDFAKDVEAGPAANERGGP